MEKLVIKHLVQWTQIALLALAILEFVLPAVLYLAHYVMELMVAVQTLTVLHRLV
jgi:hypothetical protein